MMMMIEEDQSIGSKRPRSPTSSLHGIPLCRHCTISSNVDDSLIPCSCCSLGPSDVSSVLKAASRTQNRLSRSGSQFRSHNIMHILNSRSLGIRHSRFTERWLEKLSICSGRKKDYKTEPTTKSTISISYSSDGSMFASSHGDHSIKVFDSRTRQMKACLVGHPRTPWTVKFHPRDPRIVASGCLGFQIRVWDVESGCSMFIATLEREIVSLAFHPKYDWLALASGPVLYIYPYETHVEPIELLVRRHNVRCVGFSPCGNRLILGEAAPDNSPSSTHHINHRQEVTVRLIVYDFNADAFACWCRDKTVPFDCNFFLSNPQQILPHAVLYNDGGFGLSTCGRYVCAISYRVYSEEEEEEEGSGSALETENKLTPRLTSISRRVNSIDLDSGSEGSRSLLRPPALQMPAPAIPTVRRDRPMESPPKVRRVNRAESQEEEHIRVIREQYRNRFSGVSQLRQRVRVMRDDDHSRRSTRFQSLLNLSAAPLDRPSLSTVPCRAVGENMGVYKLVVASVEPGATGRVMRDVKLTGALAKGITSVKFSPAGEHIVVGYGMRDILTSSSSSSGSAEDESHRIAAVFNTYAGEHIRKVKIITSNVDDINIACFHPLVGHGFIYGTRQGKIRSFGLGQL